MNELSFRWHVLECENLIEIDDFSPASPKQKKGWEPSRLPPRFFLRQLPGLERFQQSFSDIDTPFNECGWHVFHGGNFRLDLQAHRNCKLRVLQQFSRDVLKQDLRPKSLRTCGVELLGNVEPHIRKFCEGILCFAKLYFAGPQQCRLSQGVVRDIDQTRLLRPKPESIFGAYL